MPLDIIVTTAFGLEAVVARELKELGYAETTVEDGRIRFAGAVRAVCRANIRLRAASRVLVAVGEFPATDFGELFDRTRDLPWEDWIPVDGAFPVRGRSVRSQLHSVPDCQSIVKKAVVERLKSKYGRDWFDETGPSYGIEVSLLQDRATLTLDTSGEALHRRGYRTLVGAAPLRETLAATLVLLSYWNRERPLIDPCCGSGTIAVEAALIGRGIAPGINRSFAAEQWRQWNRDDWDDARREARSVQLPPLPLRIIGTDIDSRVLDLARQHAVAAGVADDIHFQQKPLADLRSPKRYGCVITNPPYGERIGESRDVERLYREMGKVLAPLDTWSHYVLTSHPEFERLFGRKADRRRKLYNSNIACTYYQFFGPRPPRVEVRPDAERALPPTEPD